MKATTIKATVMRARTTRVKTPGGAAPAKAKADSRGTASAPHSVRLDAVFHDAMIREVRINYQASAEVPFKIRQPEEVAGFVRRILCDNSREHLIALFLDGAHRIASYSLVSIGTATSTIVHPREVFQRAVSAGAVALVLAHNHPSGQVEASAEDRQVTGRMRDAGVLLGIPLLDHVIVGSSGYYSFQESGEL